MTQQLLRGDLSQALQLGAANIAAGMFVMLRQVKARATECCRDQKLTYWQCGSVGHLTNCG
jgi:hypothetical protein